MLRYILNDYTKLRTKTENLLFLVCVTVLALLLMFLFPNLSENFITSLIASFSIFIGFLFNLMVMLSNMVKEIVIKDNEPESKKENKKLKLKVIEKGLKIISYSIFIALLSIIFILVYSGDWTNCYKLVTTHPKLTIYFKHTFIFITYFIILNFIYSIYEILKITHILLQKEIENKNKELSK